jgi:hypothetical protein
VFGIQSLRAAVGLWQLYFETGRWRGDLRADRMTGSGRLLPAGGFNRRSGVHAIAVVRRRG